MVQTILAFNLARADEPNRKPLLEFEVNVSASGMEALLNRANRTTRRTGIT